MRLALGLELLFRCIELNINTFRLKIYFTHIQFNEDDKKNSTKFNKAQKYITK